MCIYNYIVVKGDIREGYGRRGKNMSSETMTVREYLKSLDLKDIISVFNILKRRNFALMMLQQASNYIHGLLKDFDITISIDKASLNPSFHATVNMSTEIPSHLRSLIYEHPYSIAVALEDLIEENEEIRKAIELEKRMTRSLYSPRDFIFHSKKWKQIFP